MSFHELNLKAARHATEMWLDKDELRKLKNKFNDGQLHWLNREVNDIEKTSMISSCRVCPKCPSSKLRSFMFSHSGVVIDWCSDCQGIWLDRSEYDSICEHLRSEAASATPKEIAQELAHDLKKIVTGEDPESRLAEAGDIAAALEALANAVISTTQLSFLYSPVLPRAAVVSECSIQLHCFARDVVDLARLSSRPEL